MKRSLRETFLLKVHTTLVMHSRPEGKMNQRYYAERRDVIISYNFICNIYIGGALA